MLVQKAYGTGGVRRRHRCAAEAAVRRIANRDWRKKIDTIRNEIRFDATVIGRAPAGEAREDYVRWVRITTRAVVRCADGEIVFRRAGATSNRIVASCAAIGGVRIGGPYETSSVEMPVQATGNRAVVVAVVARRFDHYIVWRIDGYLIPVCGPLFI